MFIVPAIYEQKRQNIVCVLNGDVLFVTYFNDVRMQEHDTAL